MSVLPPLFVRTSSVILAMLTAPPALPPHLIRAVRALRNVVFWVVVLRSLRRGYARWRYRGIRGCLLDMKMAMMKCAWSVLQRVPRARAALTARVDRTVASMAQDMRVFAGAHRTLPARGLPDAAVRLALASRAAAVSRQWSGAVYHHDPALVEVQTHALARFLVTNPLHPDLFPGLRQMEAEIVQMHVHLFHGPAPAAGTGRPGAGACGNVTSGGTESILMACKAYRDLAQKECPEMVIPVTAHAAFDKAGHYFKINVVKVPIQENGQVNIDQMRRAITSNTIMIVGSAPNFPHGIIDDLAALSDLALATGVPLHVDACLGSFLLPFLQEIHPNAPVVDFRLPGVTSMSIDPHKYGLGPKGTSVVLYRSHEIRKHQYFLAPEWTGGIYGSPTIAGSRPGSLIAGCWATLLFLGMDGYRSRAHHVLASARTIAAGVRALAPRLRLVGDPLCSVVAFATAPPTLVYHVHDALRVRGWHVNMLQRPPALHLACTLLTDPAAFLADLRAALDALHDVPAHSAAQAIYGTATTVDPEIVGHVVTGFLDLLTADLDAAVVVGTEKASG